MWKVVAGFVVTLLLVAACTSGGGGTHIHIHPCPDAHLNTSRYACTAHPYAKANTHPYAYADTCAHIDTHAHTDAHAHTDPYADSDPYGYPNAYPPSRLPSLSLRPPALVGSIPWMTPSPASYTPGSLRGRSSMIGRTRRP